jgi:hypothetical protein
MCLICKAEARYGDLCAECWIGLKNFQQSTHYLGRAIAYLKRKGALTTKRDARQARKRESTLKRLVKAQQKDMFDKSYDAAPVAHIGSKIVRIRSEVERRCPEIKVVRNGKIISRKDCPF